jgi:hypothetical protein
MLAEIALSQSFAQELLPQPHRFAERPSLEALPGMRLASGELSPNA